jgi:hypothetical protein
MRVEDFSAIDDVNCQLDATHRVAAPAQLRTRGSAVNSSSEYPR